MEALEIVLEVDAEQDREEARRNRIAKKRLYNKKIKPFTLITKNDFRKQFPLMWANVWNISDPSMYRDFLTRSTSPTCVFRNEHHPNMESAVMKLIPTAVSHPTLDMNFQNYAFMHASASDIVTRLLSCQIVRASNSLTSKVVMQVRISGTRLYDVSTAHSDASPGSLPLDMRDLEKCRTRSPHPAILDTHGIMIAEIDEMSYQVISLVFRMTDLVITPL